MTPLHLKLIKMKNRFLLCLFLFLCCLPVYCKNRVEKTVFELIERVTPGYSGQYKLEVISDSDNKDIYEIDGDGKKVILRGNNVVALASAFNWYLKYTCNVHVSWFGNQLNLPATLPQPVRKEQRIMIRNTGYISIIVR